MIEWPDRICERCKVKAVGVHGPDPHLCDDCNRQAALERENDRSVKWGIAQGIWPYLACQPCKVEGRIEIRGKCPIHDGGA